jgi:hypothetical protein
VTDPGGEDREPLPGEERAAADADASADAADGDGHGDGDVVPAHLRTELVRFVRALRRAGASVPANAAATGARAVVEVGLADRGRARTALRASLLADRDDFETFDRLFEEFWRRLTAGDGAVAPGSDSGAADPDGTLAPLGADPDEAGADRDADERDAAAADGDRSLVESFAAARADADDDGGDGEEATRALYSRSGSAGPVGAVRPVVADDLGRAMRELSRSLSGLPGRRFGPGADHADVRRALRSSVSTGGTVLSVPRRDRRRTGVRALLLVDVSRSVLDAVDRGFLVDFLRRARREWRDARAFFFDEALREVTDAVDAPSAAAAVAALEAAETAWGGGTRIGASLASLHERAPDAVDRRTVVFVVSDGLEMGDVSTLERELSWLARRAKRLFWLNPLAADAAYEPVARGMAAAVPYVDGLFAFTAPGDVSELSRQLRRQGPGGRVGYEFDPRRRPQRPTTTEPNTEPRRTTRTENA